MKKSKVLYWVMVYVVFWILFLITGAVSTFVTTNKVILQIMVTVCSWTSFYVLMVMFKQLLPGKTRKQFIQELFLPKLNWKLFGGIFVIQSVMFLVAVGIASYRQNVTMISLMNFSPMSICVGFFAQLIEGPLGEEPAYRGFALPEMQKKYGIIKGGLFVGVIWGMWHFPLWMISGYHGIQLLIYCITFLVSIISTSVVMSVVNFYNKNILNSILIHMMFNFTLSILYTGNLLEIFIPCAFLYFICTVIVCLVYRLKNCSDVFLSRKHLEKES